MHLVQGDGEEAMSERKEITAEAAARGLRAVVTFNRLESKVATGELETEDMTPEEFMEALAQAMLEVRIAEGATVSSGTDWRPDGIPEDYYAG